MNNTENPQQQSATDLEKESVNTKKLQAWAMIIFGFIIFILIIILVVKNTSSGEEEKTETKKNKDNNLASTVKPKEFALKEETKIEVPNEVKVDNLLNKDNVKLLNPSPFPYSQTPQKNKEIIKGLTPTVIDNKKFNSSPPPPPLNFNDVPKPNDLNNLSASNQDEFVGKTFTPTIAEKSKFDSNLLLPKGSYIGCSLKTKVISDIQGGLACTVTNDIYSSNGNVLLIEKGSTVTGMFKSAPVDDGMSRMFVIWQEIRTPNNLNIPIYSGASDELGASGLEGWIDHKWMLRFGSAVLLSIVDDSFNVMAYNATKSNSGGNNIDYTENTRENTKNMANTALQKFIDIKPTLYKNQGDMVGIYVNRDVDFSKVYKLEKNK